MPEVIVVIDDKYGALVHASFIMAVSGRVRPGSSNIVIK
ncbi:hypothetical protein FP2506_13269 [Fulvimarina pelagi HTCC2506]|uniref:Uncharacterized protein n=1 Tax=Fulvimarina pelagi HTCC2506 TaxID=314231 RepID=Q0FXM9_9HYPH|nr:hypothetical protein FP2506_13269 [Fulvimarina pelagi HTCC2506]